MKKVLYKIIFILIITLVSSPSYSQTTITMEREGGVYKVPCYVNGVKMKFIFDTGASTVCISEFMANYMLDNGFLDKKDIVGIGQSQVADGRIVDHVNIILRDIEISGMHLKDVKAIVSKSQSAPLLLGQSAIEKLGKIQIQGNKLTILNAKTKYTEDEIDRMFNEAHDYLINESYYAAAEKYGILYDLDLLSDSGKMNYAMSLIYSEKTREALNIYKEIDPYNCGQKIYLYYAWIGICYSHMNDYKNAILYAQKALRESETNSELALSYKSLANYYNYDKNYYEACNNYQMAFKYIAKKNGTSEEDLINACGFSRGGKSYLRTEESDEIFFKIMRSMYDSGQTEWSKFHRIAINLAYKGNEEARKFCRRMDIDYIEMYNLYE